MSETCVCGAHFSTNNYKRLKKWRKTHNKYHPKEVADKSGSESTTQIYEQWGDERDSTIMAKIGFTMNEEN